MIQGVSVGDRASDGAFQVTENTRLGPGDFDEYRVSVPADPRLPNGGGCEQCGDYDVKLAFFGRGTLA